MYELNVKFETIEELAEFTHRNQKASNDVVESKPKKKIFEESPISESVAESSKTEVLAYEKDIKPEVIAFVQAKGATARDELVKILKTFNAGNAGELKAEDYVAFLAALKGED